MDKKQDIVQDLKDVESGKKKLFVLDKDLDKPIYGNLKDKKRGSK